MSQRAGESAAAWKQRHSENMQVYRVARPDRAREIAAAYRASHQAEIAERARRARDEYEALKAGPCTDCGGTFPAECMDFDHVRGEKIKGVGLFGGWPAAAMLAEIEKCDLVCANCHRIRTRQRLIV